MINTNFTFNGITSQSMGVSIVRTSGGFFTVPYVASRTIFEDYPPRARTPYFFRTQPQPMTFKLSMSCIDEVIDIAKQKEIASWLFQSDYKEFISEDNPDKVWNILAINQVDFMTIGNEEGYFDIEFRCQEPYALTVATTPIYDSPYPYAQSTPVTQFTINNQCNVYDKYYPIYQITNGGTPSSVLISNLTTDKDSINADLAAGEILYVDNQKRIITSSTNEYKYDDFNKEWLYLEYGDNLIEIRGICSVTFYLQYPIWT